MLFFAGREDLLADTRFRIARGYSVVVIALVVVWLAVSFSLVTFSLLRTGGVSFPLAMFCTAPALGMLLVIGTISHHAFRSGQDHEGRDSEIYRLGTLIVEALKPKS